MKLTKKKITMITAYDHPSARLVDECGFDVILVGDSVGMVMLGYNTTIPVTMDQMIHHIKAVASAVHGALVVGDMPFGSYNNETEAVSNAVRLVKEGGADVVKLEGGARVAHIVQAIVDAGVPVMGHIGLTPQTYTALGGFRCQGKTEKQSRQILADAAALEAAGCFSVVAECVPHELATRITEQLSIPAIGIGSGPSTDGQVLVWHDMLGFNDRVPRFAKKYFDARSVIKKCLRTYKREIENCTFPSPEHTVYLAPQLQETPIIETLSATKLLTRLSGTSARIAVLGGGALGSFVASHLAPRAHVTQFTSWADHISSIKENGLVVVERDGSKTAANNVHVEPYPNIEGPLPESLRDMDLVVLCVKSHQTAHAASVARVLLAEHGAVLTLQNGNNINYLTQEIPKEKIIFGVTSHGATMLGPGLVQHCGQGPTAIAPLVSSPSSLATATALAHLMTDCGISTTAQQDPETVMWRKLVVSSAINPITALLRVRNGELERSPATRDLVERVVCEVTRVYSASHGHQSLFPGKQGDTEAINAVWDVVHETSSNVSSMLADVLRGSQTEIEAILGAVVRTAKTCDIAVPACETLFSLINATQSLQQNRVDATFVESGLALGGMQVVSEVKNLRKWRSQHKGRVVGFVPTMGCLHEGHLQLVDEAKKHCDLVVVSIFVNPSQFAPHEDLASYPRTLENDLSMLRSRGVNAVFTPTVTEMYPYANSTHIFSDENAKGANVYVHPEGFETRTFEGRCRPHFFRGVATVCTKLFNAVQPDKVFFGQKDFVQTVVIQRLVRDLLMPIDVVVCETVREVDGLAMSSRNRYLNPDQRKASAVLYRSLARAKTLISSLASGGDQPATIAASAVHDAVCAELKTEPFVKSIEYVSVASCEDANEVQTVATGDTVCVSIAVSMGGGERTVRLIDNIRVSAAKQ
eukprot:c10590_g1_i1.p1 GENE.c10590_g1_i1~~c10590_g1_i1.p1  ORF type:complete len:929 (-),score=259.88 c10590_g1_i1:113-2899(-)